MYKRLSVYEFPFDPNHRNGNVRIAEGIYHKGLQRKLLKRKKMKNADGTYSTTDLAKLISKSGLV